MPERPDLPPLDDRSQPRPVSVAPETREQAPAEPEGYPFPVDEWE
jgi:hypothetical protein